MGRLLSPNITGNAILWIVAVAIQIGGWVNQRIAITLLVIAFIWSAISVIYWIKKRKRAGKVKPSLRVVVNRVKIDDSPKTGWVVFSVSMSLESSAPIQLSKLDFDYSPELSIYPLCPAMKGPYPPLGGLPTTLVERIESYEVKYEVPGKYGTLLIEQGVLEAQKVPDSKWPQAYIHVMAGGLDFTTKPFLVPTPKRQLTPHKEGPQI